MPRFRWSYNVNGTRVGDESYFLNHIRQTQPASVLIMNNPTLGSRILDVSPDTLVIDRSWSPHEGEQHKFMSPVDYANSLKGGDKRLWRYILNEPNVGSANEAQRRNDWLVETSQHLINDGYRVVVGNFAAGSFESRHINDMAYDNLLRFLSTHRDVAKLGLHEYGAIVLPFNKDRYMAQHLVDREMVQPDTWLYLDHENPDLRLPDYRNEYIGHFYHLLRSHWLQHRCKTIGIDPVEIVLTEFGWDRMIDLAYGANNIYDVLKDHHGIPHPYQNIRGAYSHANVWEYYWGWDVSTAIYEQLKWCEANYISEWYIGANFFMWSHGDNWDIVDGFNYGADRKLHRLLETWASELRGDPDPTPAPIPEIPDMIDVLDYMRGDGRIYDVSYHFPGGEWEHGTERMQTLTQGRRFFHVKGAPGGTVYNWEELYYDHDYIYRRTDTSPNAEEYYHADEQGEYGQKWIPRFVKVGDRHLATPIVTFRRKDNCENVSGKDPYIFPHWIEVKAIHSSYTFEQSGLTVYGVLELWGYLDNGGSPGVNFERYFYAKGFGLVAWQDPTKNWQSWLSNPSVNVGDLPRKQYPCLTLPDLPPLEELPPMEFDINDPRWQTVYLSSIGSSTNIRSTPSVQLDNKVTSIGKGRPGLILVEEKKNQPDGVWYPIRLDADSDATFDDANFAVSGWVRADVFTYEIYTAPDDTPDDTRKFFHVPLPELGMTQEEIDIAYDHAVKEFNLAKLNLWCATVAKNWEKTKSGDYDGIVIVPDDTL